MKTLQAIISVSSILLPSNLSNALYNYHDELTMGSYFIYNSGSNDNPLDEDYLSVHELIWPRLYLMTKITSDKTA